MYFNLSPNIDYASKPSKFPFAEGDFVIAKNFFKRYNLDDKVFSNVVFFNKYTIKDTDRVDILAERYYGDAFYDWVILLTNNMIRGVYEWPLDEETLQKDVESRYESPYETIHHYETLEVKAGYKIDDIDVLAQKKGIIVGKEFYDGNFTYYNGSTQFTLPGNTVSTPITVWEEEVRKNEEKRQIFILKKKYLQSFLDAFRRNSQYTNSSDFVNTRLKSTVI